MQFPSINKPIFGDDNNTILLSTKSNVVKTDKQVVDHFSTKTKSLNLGYFIKY